MAVRVGCGSVDIEVEIFTGIFRVKVKLAARHRDSWRQKRQPRDIVAKGRKRANLGRPDRLIDLSAIGLQQWSLAGDFHFGRSGTDRQGGVNTDADPGVSTGSTSQVMRAPVL